MALFLALYLLYVVFREDNDMLSKTKKIMKEAVATLHLGYRITRGDAVLKDICTLLPSLVRKSDYLARYGGEEFVLVLPDTTLYSAVRLAEKLRKKIEMHETRLSDKSIRVTASFGVASFKNKPDGCSLLRAADERLYKAKAIGKIASFRIYCPVSPTELLCRKTVRTNTQIPSGWHNEEELSDSNKNFAKLLPSNVKRVLPCPPAAAVHAGPFHPEQY